MHKQNGACTRGEILSRCSLILHGHSDKCWPAEVTPNMMNFHGVLLTFWETKAPEESNDPVVEKSSVSALLHSGKRSGLSVGDFHRLSSLSWYDLLLLMVCHSSSGAWLRSLGTSDNLQLPLPLAPADRRRVHQPWCNPGTYPPTTPLELTLTQGRGGTGDTTNEPFHS